MEPVHWNTIYNSAIVQNSSTKFKGKNGVVSATFPLNLCSMLKKGKRIFLGFPRKNRQNPTGSEHFEQNAWDSKWIK